MGRACGLYQLKKEKGVQIKTLIAEFVLIFFSHLLFPLLQPRQLRAECTKRFGVLPASNPNFSTGCFSHDALCFTGTARRKRAIVSRIHSTT